MQFKDQAMAIGTALWVLGRCYRPKQCGQIAGHFYLPEVEQIAHQHEVTEGVLIDGPDMRGVLRQLEGEGLVTVRHGQWQVTAAGWLWYTLHQQVGKAFELADVMARDYTFDHWSRGLIQDGAELLHDRRYAALDAGVRLRLNESTSPLTFDSTVLSAKS